MNVTPGNIFDLRGHRIKTQRGWVTVRTRNVGGGWDVEQSVDQAPDDYSDHMLPVRYIAENMDVWTACRMLNELLDDESAADLRLLLGMEDGK